MESSPKEKKKGATRKRSKKDEQQAAEELSDSEKEINEEEESKKEEIVSPKATSPSSKKKKKKERKEKAAAEAKANEKGIETQAKPKEEVITSASPLSPRKGSTPKEDIVSPRRNTVSSVEGFSRKRSDTVITDFEEVLDVADEEGLTDDQVYISKVMRGIRKGAMYGETLAKLKRDEKELATMKEEDREPMGVEGFIRRDYKDKVMYKFNSPTPAGSRIPLMKKDKIVMMTDFAPKIFHEIRKKCNVPTEAYLKAWTFPKESLPSPNLGAGRSGSLFVSSSDHRFIFKTIPEFEVETLLEILPSLHQHCVEHPESRIIRFLGLHFFYDTITKEETHCIVMNNLLLHPTYTIEEKWDLKGRIPKPGKQGRFADKVDRSKKVLKDNDLLDRRFHLTEEARDDLLKTLNSDVEFLKTHNCMDYSLLVGVHFLKDAESEAEEQESGEQKAKEEKKSKKGKKGKKKSKKNLAEKNAVEEKEREAEEEQEEGEPALLEGVMGPLHSDPAFKKEIYFVGIIDPLSRYKLRKKVAHFLKEIIWDADTLSTVPADYYAERYSKYLAEIFVYQKPEDAAAAAVAAEVAPAKEGKVEEKEKEKEKEKEVKPEGGEEKEKKGTLKREKKKKDKVDEKEKEEKEEAVVVVADKEVAVATSVAAVPKEDSEQSTTIVDPAAAPAPVVVAPVVLGQEVEIKVAEPPKKNGTLKKKQKAKKATDEVAPAPAVVENDNSNGESVSTTTTSTSTATVGVEPPAAQGAAAPEVEIKVEGPPKKEKKNKKDGTLKKEKKTKAKE